MGQGRVVKKQGDLTFMVEIEDGVVWKRHIDQMLHADTSQSNEESSDFVTCSMASPVGSTQDSGT